MQDNASLSQQDEIDRSIAEAYEAADFLTEFVVQAKLNERGNFGELTGISASGLSFWPCIMQKSCQPMS